MRENYNDYNDWQLPDEDWDDITWDPQSVSLYCVRALSRSHNLEIFLLQDHPQQA